jgi:hypothetical protein
VILTENKIFSLKMHCRGWAAKRLNHARIIESLLYSSCYFYPLHCYGSSSPADPLSETCFQVRWTDARFPWMLRLLYCWCLARLYPVSAYSMVPFEGTADKTPLSERGHLIFPLNKKTSLSRIGNPVLSSCKQAASLVLYKRRSSCVFWIAAKFVHPV